MTAMITTRMSMRLIAKEMVHFSTAATLGRFVEFSDASGEGVALGFEFADPLRRLARHDVLACGLQKQKPRLGFISPRDAGPPAVALVANHHVEFSWQRRSAGENDLRPVWRQISHETIEHRVSVVKDDAGPDISAVPMKFSTVFHGIPQ